MLRTRCLSSSGNNISVKAIAAIAGLGFYGELREQAWRRYPQTVLFLLLAFIGWWYWPTEQM